MATKNLIETEMSRRQMLGWLAVGATGLLIPAIVKPKPKVFDMGRATTACQVFDTTWQAHNRHVCGRPRLVFPWVLTPGRFENKVI
jgi:hypothetical protein